MLLSQSEVVIALRTKKKKKKKIRQRKTRKDLMQLKTKIINEPAKIKAYSNFFLTKVNIMSYNGIGLQTARGSGTSGHIQRNLASLKDDDSKEQNIGHYKRRQLQEDQQARQRTIKSNEANRAQARTGIKEHDTRRYIDIRCMELRDEMEDNSEDEDKIEVKVRELRDSLIKKQEEMRKRKHENNDQYNTTSRDFSNKKRKDHTIAARDLLSTIRNTNITNITQPTSKPALVSSTGDPDSDANNNKSNDNNNDNNDNKNNDNENDETNREHKKSTSLTFSYVPRYSDRKD